MRIHKRNEKTQQANHSKQNKVQMQTYNIELTITKIFYFNQSQMQINFVSIKTESANKFADALH